MSDRVELSAKQIRGLASVPRLSIVASLRANGPQSIGELAEDLATEPKGLYYHVRALEALNLVLPHSTRSTKRRQETVYACSGPAFNVDLSGTDPVRNEAVRALARTIIRQNAKLLDRAIGQLQPSAPERKGLNLQTINMRLSPKDLAEFEERIIKLQDWAASRTTPEGMRVMVTLFSQPMQSGSDE